MTILNDRQITELAYEKNMISPFVPEKVRQDENGVGCISYGVSSFGYDMRVADEIKVFVPMPGKRIDPKRFDAYCLADPLIQVDDYGLWFELPAHSFMLGKTVERFSIPDDIVCVCVGKSTYARCGLILNVTPLEPGWTGHVTLELSNTTSLPALVYLNEGIGQVLFFRGDEVPLHTYGDGKYQGQESRIVLPRV